MPSHRSILRVAAVPLAVTPAPTDSVNGELTGFAWLDCVVYCPEQNLGSRFGLDMQALRQDQFGCAMPGPLVNLLNQTL